jgi:hypothetical protein
VGHRKYERGQGRATNVDMEDLQPLSLFTTFITDKNKDRYMGNEDP